jgi:hypothetical protein
MSGEGAELDDVGTAVLFSVALKRRFMRLWILFAS